MLEPLRPLSEVTMNTRLTATKLVVLASAWLAFSGCAAELQTDAQDDDAVQSEPAALAPGAQELSFTEFTDPNGIGTAGQQKTRVLITSAQRYARLFGHDAPADIDFAAGDAVIFYSAGVKPTGGYDASVLSIVLDRHRLRVTTQLESPSSNCIVTESLTTPNVLVKVRLTAFVRVVRFRADNTVRDCSEPPAFCGGIAGFPCPDGQECIDNPSDDCDPANGGADCGGICVPATNSDPCATVRCQAGTECRVSDMGTPACVAVGPSCGGIAARPCPGSGRCVDDPTDSCDPNAGGADCGGVCACVQNVLCTRDSVFDSSPEVCACVPKVCVQNVLCARGTTFDNSPDVCACVPDASACAAVLCPTGTTCEVHDGDPSCVSNGSEACGTATCAAGTYCCNASCGTCLPPGMACTQIACL
jgi:hypothetical protein